MTIDTDDSESTSCDEPCRECCSSSDDCISSSFSCESVSDSKCLESEVSTANVLPGAVLSSVVGRSLSPVLLFMSVERKRHGILYGQFSCRA